MKYMSEKEFFEAIEYDSNCNIVKDELFMERYFPMLQKRYSSEGGLVRITDAPMGSLLNIKCMRSSFYVYDYSHIVTSLIKHPKQGSELSDKEYKQQYIKTL